MIKSQFMLSVVLLASKAELLNIKKWNDVTNILSNNYSDYEVIIVEDRKNLDEQEISLLKEIPCIRYIKLASCVTNNTNFFVGIENAIGDFVFLAKDFQRYFKNPDLILKLVEKSKSGYDIVFSDRVLMNEFNAVIYSRRMMNCLIGDRQAINFFNSSIKYSVRKAVYINDKIHEIKNTEFIDIVTKVTFFSLDLLMAFLAVMTIATSRELIYQANMLLLISSYILIKFGYLFAKVAYDNKSEKVNYTILFEKTSSILISKDRINVLDESISTEENRVQTARND